MIFGEYSLNDTRIPNMIFGEYSLNDTRIPNVIQGIFPNSGILGFLGILRHKQTPTLPAEAQKSGVYGLGVWA